MELQFNKVGSRWEAEFEATGNFNLHIERKKAGGLAIYQKASADDKYATDSSWSDNAPAVVNKDFSMLIYPKMIKVTSRSEPIQGIVTMEGEGSSSGGSGGLSIRPFTVDDGRVTMFEDGIGEEMDYPDYANGEITVIGYTKVYIYSDKVLYTGPANTAPLTYEESAGRYVYLNTSMDPATVIFDLYVAQ